MLPAIGRSIGIKSNYAAQLRHRIRNGHPISTDLKLKLLQRSGWRHPQQEYTRAQLVEAVRFAIKQGDTAKTLGAEYVVQKFLNTGR